MKKTTMAPSFITIDANDMDVDFSTTKPVQALASMVINEGAIVVFFMRCEVQEKGRIEKITFPWRQWLLHL
jgi:hypothetical protein